jgi:hypothetical protein
MGDEIQRQDYDLRVARFLPVPNGGRVEHPRAHHHLGGGGREK